MLPDTLEKYFCNVTDGINVSQFNQKKLMEVNTEQKNIHNKPTCHRAIYFISESENVSIEEVSKTYAFSILIKNILHLDIKSNKINKIQFEFLNKLLASVDFYRLNYPKNYDSLNNVYNLVKNN